jgi:ferrous iron transport protein B
VLTTETYKVAIVGNPNVGKSTIFNQLTGLTQKTGNYPGVTVDKKLGYLKSDTHKVVVIDLPGTYSIFPNSEDEVVVHRVLNNIDLRNRPDCVLVVIDASNIERGLFLASQVMELALPTAILFNMMDIAEAQGITIDQAELQRLLGVPLFFTSANPYKNKSDKNIDIVKEIITEKKFSIPTPFLDFSSLLPAELVAEICKKFPVKNAYQVYQLLRFKEKETLIKAEDKKWLENIANAYHLDSQAVQKIEIAERYAKIQTILTNTVAQKTTLLKGITERIDEILLHKTGGYAIFATILLLIFQAIFTWASVPMDWIDGFFGDISSWISATFPAGALTSLLADGIVPGIGGVVIFIPQIALLFGFLAVLEDTGYMSRVVFLMDRLMRPFGLHGKSIVPLVSGIACAIPAIMAARHISNWKERLITILVTPFMSCSARLPVYIILIGISVPDTAIFGFINLQALALLVLYLLGTMAVFAGAYLLKKVIKTDEISYLIIEMPVFRVPRLKDILFTMYSKATSFVLEAGKVILSISVILWVLASYSPDDVSRLFGNDRAALSAVSSSEKLEKSFIGILGKSIEPVIEPLGYDWKIGIALISSFAAREVFVSTIATIYSLADDSEETTIKARLAREVNPVTGEKVFSRATSFSLLVFYVFAMQCLSTLAVVYKETKSWKYPILQTVIMTSFAYILAFIVYQLFS